MVPVNSTDPVVLRVRFQKVGSLCYISHLDVMRTMYKILVRSRLPMKYSEGFNPKPRMAFAAPLPLGAESVYEYMDLRLERAVDPAWAMERLNACVTEEMRVIEAYYPETRLSDLRWFSYTYRIRTDGADPCMAEQLLQALSRPVVEVVKKTDAGERTVDIRPLFRDAAVTYASGDILIHALLSADPSSFLSPQYILQYLHTACGILSDPDLTREYYSILRDGAFRADMTPFH